MSVTRIGNVRILFRCFCFAGLAGLALLAQADGLARVEQTIFGMDCAPCAYGIEQGLKKLPGITGVRVSLNEGLAVVSLAADNSTTIENIRKVIRDNGETIRIEGEIPETTAAAGEVKVMQLQSR